MKKNENKIKKLRLELNITQENFANAISREKSLISKWENNKIVPTKQNYDEIIKAFQLDQNYFKKENEIFSKKQIIKYKKNKSIFNENEKKIFNNINKLEEENVKNASKYNALINEHNKNNKKLINRWKIWCLSESLRLHFLIASVILLIAIALTCFTFFVFINAYSDYDKFEYGLNFIIRSIKYILYKPYDFGNILFGWLPFSIVIIIILYIVTLFLNWIFALIYKITNDIKNAKKNAHQKNVIANIKNEINNIQEKIDILKNSNPNISNYFSEGNEAIYLEEKFIKSDNDIFVRIIKYDVNISTNKNTKIRSIHDSFIDKNTMILNIEYKNIDEEAKIDKCFVTSSKGYLIVSQEILKSISEYFGRNIISNKKDIEQQITNKRIILLKDEVDNYKRENIEINKKINSLNLELEQARSMAIKAEKIAKKAKKRADEANGNTLF